MIRLLSLLNDAVYLYSLLMVIYALLSWFPGGYQSGIGRILRKICEPYLRLFDRFNFNFGPVDFTIMVALVVLNLASRGLTMLVYNLMF